MQAWTPVLVTDDTHPRAGSAGVAQGAPFVPESSAASTAADAEAAASAAEAEADDAEAVAADAASAAKAKRQAAEALRADAEAAKAGAAKVPAITEPHVSVRFDVDGAVELIAASKLREL